MMALVALLPSFFKVRKLRLHGAEAQRAPRFFVGNMLWSVNASSAFPLVLVASRCTIL